MIAVLFGIIVAVDYPLEAITVLASGIAVSSLTRVLCSMKNRTCICRLPGTDLGFEVAIVTDYPPEDSRRRLVKRTFGSK